MTLFKRILAALTSAFLILTLLSTFALISLMFDSGREIGRHTTLFGGLFFESKRTSSGAIMVGFGLNDPVPLLVVFVVAAVIVFIFLSILSFLQQRRQMLLNDSDDHEQ